jgi:hypothetical protein
VKRASFDRWIQPELTAIEGAVDQALARAGLTEAGVDRVFLTGGSSFVPAVRGIFERRFGAGKLESGAELVSIATGLALLGAEDDLDAETGTPPSRETWGGRVPEGPDPGSGASALSSPPCSAWSPSPSRERKVRPHPQTPPRTPGSGPSRGS